MAITCDLDCNKELDVIFKGTTPTFNFNVCLDTSLVDIENTHIVFTSGRAVVDKSGDDIIIGEGVMSCSLTQAETMSFTGSQYPDSRQHGQRSKARKFNYDYPR